LGAKALPVVLARPVGQDSLQLNPVLRWKRDGAYDGPVGVLEISALAS
jgi:hypothetical protein